ncbi:DUF7284 family protein [Salinibaculum salinum]|uniref:DUF7284 family protein n=1 Tax=Salinibaculum salinum TaxID=3131996 RepID=UPI0030ED751A
MRAVSTVLDVAVFLLLVSAAVGTLVLADPPEQTDSRADETAEIIASSTLSIEYGLAGETRYAHGTIAELLARAAVANASFEGASLASMDGRFSATVTKETSERLVAPNRTQIVARWVPYRGGPLQGHTVVGQAPPDGLDVHSATISVSVPVAASQERAANRSEDGYDAVARTVAVAVADGLLPDNRVDASAFRESPTASATTHRYETFAEATETGVSGLLESGSVGTAHNRIVAGLARTFAADMRDRFDTPAKAAEAVQTGTVHITVRRWDA